MWTQRPWASLLIGRKKRCGNKVTNAHRARYKQRSSAFVLLLDENFEDAIKQEE